MKIISIIMAMSLNCYYCSPGVQSSEMHLSLFKGIDRIAYSVTPQAGSLATTECNCHRLYALFKDPIDGTSITNLSSQVKKDNFDGFDTLILEKFDLNGLKLTLNLMKSLNLNDTLKTLIFGDIIVEGEPLPSDCNVETRFESCLTKFFSESNGKYVKSIERFVYNKPIYNITFLNAIFELPSLKRPQIYLADGIGWAVENLVLGNNYFYMTRKKGNCVAKQLNFKPLSEYHFDYLSILFRKRVNFTPIFLKKHDVKYPIFLINITNNKITPINASSYTFDRIVEIMQFSYQKRYYQDITAKPSKGPRSSPSPSRHSITPLMYNLRKTNSVTNKYSFWRP